MLTDITTTTTIASTVVRQLSSSRYRLMRRNIAIECCLVVEISVSVAINRCDCISILRVYHRDEGILSICKNELASIESFQLERQEFVSPCL
jgi:hypothetical protein